MKMQELLARETRYPNLVRYIRAGGRLEVSLDTFIGSLARINIGRQGHAFPRTDYRDFAEILEKMDDLAKRHFEAEV